MSKSATQRENDALKAEIDRLKRNHRADLHAKNQEIENLRALTPRGLRDLCAAFQNLRPLLHLLEQVRQNADPVSSVYLDPDSANVTEDSLHERPIEGQGTKAERERQVRTSGRVSRIAAQIERDLGKGSDEEEEGPRGYRDSVVVGGEQCWHRHCRDTEGTSTRGRKQSWDNDYCQWCGCAFGSREPADDDSEMTV